MPELHQDSQHHLLRYLHNLRLRARLIAGSSALGLAVAVNGGMLAVAAAWAGVVVTPTWAITAWALVGLSTLSIFGYAGMRWRRHRGLAAAGLLATQSTELAASLRGALELSLSPAPGQSENLLQAHLDAVAERLQAHPPEKVLPWSSARRRLAFSLMAALVCAGLLTLHPNLRRGFASLREPARVDADGTLIATVVEHFHARLLFPSYLERSPLELTDVSQIEAPAGTTVEVTVTPRIDATHVSLRIPDGSIRLSRQGEAFAGRFVVRDSGPLFVRLQDADATYQDRQARSLVAHTDRIPIVEITEPQDGDTVDATQPLAIVFRAQDDEGLQHVDLVVRLPGGQEVRHRLWSADGTREATTVLDGHEPLQPVRLGVRPGDPFSLWLEARDGDVVSGPNIGRSATLSLLARSQTEQLSAHLPALKAVLDLGVSALADRLEADDGPNGSALQHVTRLASTTKVFVDALKAFVDALEETVESAAMSAGQLRAMTQRVAHKQKLEHVAAQRDGVSSNKRKELSRELVLELEGDVLLLADLLSQAHIQEAQALSAELQELRKRMQQLLADLSSANSEQAKQELFAELARAESRLRELMRSMSQMAARVPSEFVNEEAVEQAGTGETMKALRDAIEQGDIEAAAARLEQLEQQLASLSQNLAEGGLRFRESRFGPRDKAMMEAQEKLAMLHQEQERLAQQSAQRTRQIMGRNPDHAPGNVAELNKLAERVQREMERMDPSAMGPSEQDSFEHSRQRVRDTQDALRTGDLSEASRMAAAGHRALDQMSRDLGIDAQMFPGHNGRTADNARAADSARRAMERLSEAVDSALPRLSEQTTREDLNHMQAQAQAQGKATSAARDLQRQFEHGPDGLPLSPEAGQAMGDAQRAMEQAEQQLRRGDPKNASLSQEEAAEQLQRLSQRLAQEQAMQQGGGDGSGDGRESFAGKVDIPGDKDFKAPQELRRRLLDAMREASPAGYEGAVQNYYKELLR